MRITVIDGHNLILRVQALTEKIDYEGRRASREEAEALILAWADREGEGAVRLVYDGRLFEGSHPGSRDEGRLQVRFADPPAEADDLIRHEAMEASLRADAVVVVTGDKALARSVEEYGARVVDPGSFFRELTRKPPSPDKERRFSADEIDALRAEMMERGEGEPDRVVEETPRPAPRKPTPPEPRPPRPKQPAVRPRPEKEERREKFQAKRKRGAGKGKPKSRKKRRGY